METPLTIPTICFSKVVLTFVAKVRKSLNSFFVSPWKNVVVFKKFIIANFYSFFKGDVIEK